MNPNDKPTSKPVPTHSADLAKSEVAAAAAQRAREDKLYNSLNDFLVNNKVTVGEMGRLMQRFSQRNDRVIAAITSKELHERDR